VPDDDLDDRMPPEMRPPKPPGAPADSGEAVAHEREAEACRAELKLGIRTMTLCLLGYEAFAVIVALSGLSELLAGSWALGFNMPLNPGIGQWLLIGPTALFFWRNDHNRATVYMVLSALPLTVLNVGCWGLAGFR
jgi:hypothetical protein